jgi:hypothetical protein
MVLSRCLELRFHAVPQTQNDPCALQFAWELFDVHQLFLELASGSTSLFSVASSEATTVSGNEFEISDDQSHP